MPKVGKKQVMNISLVFINSPTELVRVREIPQNPTQNTNQDHLDWPKYKHKLANFQNCPVQIICKKTQSSRSPLGMI